MARALRDTLLLIGAALCLLTAVLLERRAQTDPARQAGAEVVYLPPGDVIEALSLGYRTLAADLLWVGALQSYDSRAGRHRAPEHIAAYADAIIHLDPDFTPVYRWAGTALIFAAPSPLRFEDVERANAYLALGAARFADDPYYPRAIGLNYAFWTPGDDPERKREMIARGVAHLERAARLPGAPEDLALTIAGLLDLGDDPARRVDFLERAYLSSRDPEVRRKLERRLRELADHEQLRGLERQRRLRARWHARHRPYLPQALAFIIGAPPAPTTLPDPPP